MTIVVMVMVMTMVVVAMVVMGSLSMPARASQWAPPSVTVTAPITLAGERRKLLESQWACTLTKKRI
eukprot:9388197-Pyramimonas_sp.AAC.1